VFVVVEGFPEADPDVEQSQAAAQTAKEAGGDEGTEPGKREQKIIVGPLGGPGQDHEQDTGDGADQHKKEDGGTVQPELHTTVGQEDWGWRRWVEERGAGVRLSGRGWGSRDGAFFDRQIGIEGHWALRCNGDGAGKNQDPSLRSG